ncbi:MAG: hypothetical protein ACOC56_01020 [Atribacterota bacterium]
MLHLLWGKPPTSQNSAGPLHDIYVDIPPKKEYEIKAKITKVEKAEPQIYKEDFNHIPKKEKSE